MRTGIVGGCGAAQIGVAMALLAGCGGGGGSGSASSDIESSINALIKDHDCAAATAAYRKTVTGDSDVKKCSHDLALRNPVKKLQIGKVNSSGSSGTAAITTDGTKTTLKLTKQSGKWLVAGDTAGGSDGSASSKTTSTPAAPASPAGGDKKVARARYGLALASYQAGRRRFKTRVLQDLRARNLAAVKGDFGQYRDTVFEFDGQVRKIHFPAAAHSDLNHLLEADRAEIADLDAVGSARDFSELQRLLTTRLQSDDSSLSQAIKALARDV